MKALVTGASGFTGGYVVSQLISRGYSVVSLKSDLMDKNSLIEEVGSVQPDMVIHLAAVSFVGHGCIDDFYRVNVIGTRNLLEALYLRCDNLRKILLASSANVYGNQAGCELLAEDVCPSPENDYSVSKLAMEFMARTWSSKLPIFIVRPFNYTGVGQHEGFLVPKIVKHFKRKSTVIELGNLDVHRDIGDVRTVSSIYVNLLERAQIGGLYNISTGVAHSLRDILSMCESIAGYKIDVKVNPKFVRENEVKFLAGDNSRLMRVLGDLNLMSFEETLRWMFRG